jgi:RNA polymerase sigma-70 factor (ECF subfamily)
VEAGESSPRAVHDHDAEPAKAGAHRQETGALTDSTSSFHDRFVELFDAHFNRLWRVMDRLSGDPELAADCVQEAFIKLHQRGALPDAPESWLITVALNLFRNTKASGQRRRRLLTLARAEGVHADPAPSPEQAALSGDARRQVRRALERLPERERQLLLLQAEGYRYRDIAAALDLNEASVGVLLARAKRTFRAIYEDKEGADDALR